jgi:hypothetical protein
MKGKSMSRKLIIIPLLFVIGLGCSSTRSITQDGETNWLRKCQGEDECGGDLSCVCGLCTKPCVLDDACDDLAAGSQCVSVESFAEVADCQESVQMKGAVCDLLCTDDDDCRALDSDAICQSGSCRRQKLGRIPDTPNKDGDAADSKDGASKADSGPDADALEAIDMPISSLSETELKERRAQVISEYCALIEQYPCLSWPSSIAGLPTNGSIEEQIEYCEMSMEIFYYNAVHPDCYQQWEALHRCYASHERSCPCDGQQWGCDAPYDSAANHWETCLQEQIAYNNCEFWLQNDQNFDIEGERATCSGHVRANDHGDCDIQCDISLDYYFWATCEGPADGPVRCKCYLNRETLSDIFADGPDYYYASDCREATQAMADGRCIDIINCCMSWTDSDGNDVCGCTADPTRPYLGRETGATSCQELADLVEGEVVDLCPEHAPIDWGGPGPTLVPINWEFFEVFPF